MASCSAASRISREWTSLPPRWPTCIRGCPARSARRQRLPASPTAWSRTTGTPARIAVRQRVHAAAEVHTSLARPDACERPIPTTCRPIVAWLQCLRGRGTRRGAPRRGHRAHLSPQGGRSRRRLARLGRRRPGLARRLRQPDAERHPGRPRLHPAGTPWPRLCDVARRRAHRRAARRRPRVLLPLHRPREPDLERDLREDRLRAGRRLGSVVVPAAGVIIVPCRYREGCLHASPSRSA